MRKSDGSPCKRSVSWRHCKTRRRRRGINLWLTTRSQAWSRIRDGTGGLSRQSQEKADGVTPVGFFSGPCQGKGGRSRLSPHRQFRGLLADMPAAVFALEPSAGLADEAVARGPVRIVSAAIAVIVIGVGVAAERGRRNRARGADRAAYDVGCDISRPEAGVPAIVVPGVMPAVVPIRLIVPSALFAAIGRVVAVGGSGIRISRSQVRAIGIREFGLAPARISRSLPVPSLGPPAPRKGWRQRREVLNSSCSFSVVAIGAKRGRQQTFRVLPSAGSNRREVPVPRGSRGRDERDRASLRR